MYHTFATEIEIETKIDRTSEIYIYIYKYIYSYKKIDTPMILQRPKDVQSISILMAMV